MARYIDAENAISVLEILADKCVDDKAFEQTISILKAVPTEDVVPKENINEFIISELTNKISERIIKFLEENYEITPKKSAVRCKDCMWFNNSCPIQAVAGVVALKEDTCCLFVERK